MLGISIRDRIRIDVAHTKAGSRELLTTMTLYGKQEKRKEEEDLLSLLPKTELAYKSIMFALYQIL
jgi:hypothetical protein